MEIITTHKNVDFDALASVMAAKLIHPDALPVLPKAINPNVKGFLSIHKDIFDPYSFSEIEISEVNRLIIVDTNNWSRLDGSTAPLKNKHDLEVVIWDHHEQGDIKPVSSCQEEAGATITLLIRELRKKRTLITPIQATLFLLGLYEDTGNLTFPATTAEDAMAASYLLERKADLNILSTFLMQVYGEKQKEILFEMLKNAVTSKINGHSISFNRVEVSGHVGNLSAVVNMYRNIVNADAAIGIFVEAERDRVMIIGRSKNEDLNIGKIMRVLGGGGHPAAGSALMKSVNPDTVIETITELIKGDQQGSILVGDIMSFPVFSILQDSSMEDLSKILVEKGCTGMPVVNGEGHMVGVVSKRDFRKVKKTQQMQSPVKAFMSPNLVTISPEKSVMEAARIMVKYDIGRLPVLQDGKLIGIISRSDMMNYFYDMLPD